VHIKPVAFKVEPNLSRNPILHSTMSAQQRDWCGSAAKLRVDECRLLYSRTALSLCHQERITMTVRSIKAHDTSIYTRAYTIPSCPAGHVVVSPNSQLTKRLARE